MKLRLVKVRRGTHPMMMPISAREGAAFRKVSQTIDNEGPELQQGNHDVLQ